MPDSYLKTHLGIIKSYTIKHSPKKALFYLILSATYGDVRVDFTVSESEMKQPLAIHIFPLFYIIDGKVVSLNEMEDK